jgi:hypothetical protein
MSKAKMIKIRCHQVWFYSPADESSFFGFIKEIKAVRKLDGVGEDFFLHVKPPVSNKSLIDLIGLFKRYRIELAELSCLKNKKNTRLFNTLTN